MGRGILRCRGVNLRQSLMRTGNDLVQATKPYVAEDRRKSWTSFAAISLIVLSVLVAIALVPLTGPSGIALKFGLGTLLGLLQIRLFIFYHDYLHGALLRRSKRAEVLMAMVGAYMLSVRSVWRETHNYHHKNNAKMIGSAIGSFPLVTTKIWARMDRRQRLLYKTVRHPLFIFGGYFTVFLLGMSLPPYKRDPEKHRGAPLAVRWWRPARSCGASVPAPAGLQEKRRGRLQEEE